MAVSYTFAGATAAIPLSQLDSNFATPITLGNTAIQLGNTVTTLNNMTFANVTISSVATAITIAQGGTGQTTANAAFNALAPSQTGNAGKYLTTDGTNTSWATNPLGTVTSVDVSGGTTGLTTSGGPVTTSGTITLAGTLATTNGGTGLTSFTANRVFYASSTSAIGSSANLTFDGTTLTANALTLTNNPTLNGGTANGVLYLNGSKVATSGSALTFDGTNTLTVGTSAVASSNLVLNSSTVAGFGGALNIQNGGTLKSQITSKSVATGGGTDQSLWIASQSDNLYLSATASTGNLIFGLGPGYSFSEQMRLTSTGLGIGTSSPATKLDVNGNTNISGELRSTTRLRVYSGANSIHWISSVSDLVGSGSATDAAFGAYGSFNWYPNNGTTLAMKLDTSGNLGLGVTPGAWVGSKVLQVSGVGAFYADGITYNYTTGVANNCYQTGSSTWAYRVAATNAARYEQNGNAHSWYISSGSPVAGGAVTFTQAMTLDASGNLGVGTTSQTYRLGVNGSVELQQVSGAGLVSNFTYPLIYSSEATGNFGFNGHLVLQPRGSAAAVDAGICWLVEPHQMQEHLFYLVPTNTHYDQKIQMHLSLVM